MKNLQKILFAALAIALTICALLFDRNAKLRSETTRLSENLSAVCQSCDTLKTVNGSLMSDCQRILAEKYEMAENYKYALSKAEELGVKLNRMQSVTVSQSETHLVADAVIRDTVIIHDSISSPSQTFRYRDYWTDIVGVIDSGKASIEYTGKDTITQVVYRVPKKWWFLKWGTKAIRQRVSSSNPHSNIVYTEYIDIKK